MKKSNLFITFLLLLSVSCATQGSYEHYSSSLIKPPSGVEYTYHIPPKDIPYIIAGDVWLAHFKNDLLPYWITDDAKGVPQGNFPSFRKMDGKVISWKTDRYPRMIGRQVFVYSMGFLMTGDEKLLQIAKDGVDWLLDKAKDKTYGGWYAKLDEKGKPYPGQAKTAQDLAYTVQGPAAYFFVTRDPASEKAVLESFNLIFNPDKYWDKKVPHVVDAMDENLSKEIDLMSDGGWDLTAQLDQINAYVLLSQPVLSNPGDREKFLAGLKTLAQVIIDNYWMDGVFFGVNNQKDNFYSQHTDFGHTLKTYWMILQIDKRLPDHPFKKFIFENVYYWVKLAYQETRGMWADKMSGYDSVSGGNRSWWIYAECDQLVSTLNMVDYRYIPVLAKTLTNWMRFVDKDYPCGEVYSDVNYYGGHKGDIPADSDMKCNQWKNGFHSTEHALVMYLLGKSLEQKPVSLYFAVPPAITDTFIAKPYLFEGTETGRSNLGSIVIDGVTLSKVKVTFEKIW